MSAHGAPAPVQQSIGPVRSPSGLVDVEITARDVVLRAHDSWRDWFDSELLMALAALSGIASALGGLVVGGPLGVVMVALGLLLFVPVVLLIVATYAAMGFVIVQTAVRLATRGGRARLKREASGMLGRLGETRQWQAPRAQVVPLGPVELGRRARLRLGTPSGELVLTAPRWRRSRLEQVSWALQSR